MNIIDRLNMVIGQMRERNKEMLAENASIRLRFERELQEFERRTNPASPVSI